MSSLQQSRTDADVLETVAMPTREEMQKNFERIYPVDSSSSDYDFVRSNSGSRGVKRKREESEEPEEEKSLEEFLNKVCDEVWQEKKEWEQKKKEQEELDRQIEEAEARVEQMEKLYLETYGDEYAEHLARVELKKKLAEDFEAGRLGPMVRRKRRDRHCEKNCGWCSRHVQ